MNDTSKNRFRNMDQQILSLCKAHLSNTQLERFPSSALTKSPTLAYAIQHIVIHEKINQLGESFIGYKLCLPQISSEIANRKTTPLYGLLTDSNISNGIIILDNMHEPRIETKLIFFINSDISACADIDEVIAKTNVAPGIEIPDSRFSNWFPNISVNELISDNCAAGQFVFGNPVQSSTIDPKKKILASLYSSNNIHPCSESAWTFEHALESIVHANQLASHLTYDGMAFKKGMILALGGENQAMALYRGTYKADFKELGDVSLIVR